MDNERDLIVAFLQGEKAYEIASNSEHHDLLALAEAIERGDHLPKGSKSNG